MLRIKAIPYSEHYFVAKRYCHQAFLPVKCRVLPVFVSVMPCSVMICQMLWSLLSYAFNLISGFLQQFQHALLSRQVSGSYGKECSSLFHYLRHLLYPVGVAVIY